VSDIGDWETRIEAVASLAARQAVRLLCGMPSWVMILFDRIARARRAAGRPVSSMGECWPQLRVFVHGGVAFAPYRALFEQWIGQGIDFVEVYPASEGFVAVQTERTGGLTLMLDYGVFYEFIPVEDLGGSSPRRLTAAEVEPGAAYAVVLTTAAGLWSYLLGDTVRFTARDPLRLEITGRTRHFVNAFGENVIVEEVERALVTACRRAHAEIVEFTVAPRYPSPQEPRGGHDWLVEFDEPPRCSLEVFVRTLDETLMALNTDYRTKRTAGVGMVGPRLVELPAGTFYRWMRERGQLGDQHKVPRVTNDRGAAETLLAAAGRSGASHFRDGSGRSGLNTARRRAGPARLFVGRVGVRGRRRWRDASLARCRARRTYRGVVPRGHRDPDGLEAQVRAGQAHGAAVAGPRALQRRALPRELRIPAPDVLS
jgi:hypothetical protein